MAITEEREGIAFPGDPAYDFATRVFNLAAPAEPAAAVTARTIDQIRAALRYAEAEGLPVRVHTTGHAATTAASMHNAVLVRTQLDGGVDIDSRARAARIPAGTLWSAVVEAAAPHGLAAPHGSAPTVGVVGFLLRGGLSFYSRKFGLSANSVRAIELVTADGEHRRVDASSDPELLWALRGGGGGLGIVTAVEIDLFPAAKVVTGAAFWPAKHAPRLAPRWLRWTAGAPWAVTTSLRLMNLPKLPEIPPALTQGTVLCVDGVVLSETEDGVPTARRQAEDLLGPLRSVADPVLDTWELTTPSAVPETHMDPTDPVAVHGDHLLLGELGDEGMAEFLRTCGEGSRSPLVIAALRQLGGAVARPDPAGGVLDHLTARLLYSGAGVPETPRIAAAISNHCAATREALSPWDTGTTAPSFVESLDQPQGHLSPDQVHAVDRVRRRVDPNGRFRGDVMPNTTALR